MLWPNVIKPQSGFTLIELVTVIVLLGIVTVYVAPRFSNNNTFIEYSARDQMISAFRYAQQRAMYDHSGNCYSLLIDANGFGPQRDDGSSIEYFGPIGQIEFSGDLSQASATVQTVYFDGLGNALSGSCNGLSVANPLTITITSSASSSVALEIFPSGYVRPI